MAWGSTQTRYCDRRIAPSFFLCEDAAARHTAATSLRPLRPLSGFRPCQRSWSWTFCAVEADATIVIKHQRQIKQHPY